MNYDKIGSFIAEKRKEKNLTQKELASKIGVTDKAVSKWERGLGCPDVSILEVLATELGVSILEILKGRIIENEVIKVTEMNDYVKETVNYSEYANKNKLKDIISKIITFIIILTGSILIILNIIHIAYLNDSQEWNFDNDLFDEMRENVNQIEKNINIIKNNQGIYSDEDYEKILNNLEQNNIQNYKELYILNNTGTKKVKMNDLFIMDLDTTPALATIDTYRVISKYDESANDYLKIYLDTFMVKAYLGNSVFAEPSQTYRYQLFDIPNENYTMDTNFYRFQSRVYNYQYMIDSYLYLTKTIIKVGEINE